MKEIPVQIKDSSYNIYCGNDIMAGFQAIFKDNLSARQVLIISNARIFNLYGPLLKANLPDFCIPTVCLVEDDEKAKSQKYVDEIYTTLLQNTFERNSVVIALGGGVVGDLAGFVAATYLRGIHFIQMPTSLLAQVDSSIGGKTGINHPLGKNLIGAFKQPVFVFSDIKFLQTLAAEEIRCGLGEVIKYAFILDTDLFIYLEKNIEKALAKEAEILNHLVETSSRLKADVVAQDEKEAGLRMILNYGHTFGHALEAEFGYGKLKHGEAVILGMKCALHYTQRAGYINEQDFERGIALLNRVPVVYDKQKIAPENLLKRMFVDKKVQDQNIRLVLVKELGTAVIENKANLDLIRSSFEMLKK